MGNFDSKSDPPDPVTRPDSYIMTEKEKECFKNGGDLCCTRHRRNIWKNWKPFPSECPG